MKLVHATSGYWRVHHSGAVAWVRSRDPQLDPPGDGPPVQVAAGATAHVFLNDGRPVVLRDGEELAELCRLFHRAMRGARRAERRLDAHPDTTALQLYLKLLAHAAPPQVREAIYLADARHRMWTLWFEGKREQRPTAGPQFRDGSGIQARFVDHLIHPVQGGV